MLHASPSEHFADQHIHILTKYVESSVTLKDWFTTLWKLHLSDLAWGRERHFTTGTRADSLDTTLFRILVLAFLFSPTSSGRHYAGFFVVIKTPGICVNFALINEIMLFAIISGLISRITWFLSSVYLVYFGKIYRFIYAEFPKGNTIVGKRQIQAFRAQHTCYWARLKTVKGLFFDTFLSPVRKL